MKKKLFTLMTFMLCVVASSHADETATVVKTWDFTTITSSDVSSLASNGWEEKSSGTYYQNKDAITNASANGVSQMSNLEITATAGKFRIYTGGKGIYLDYNNGAQATITIKGLKQNQIISVSINHSGGSNDKRGVAAENVTAIGDNSFTAQADKNIENIGKVTSDGTVTLKADGGAIYITKISVSEVISDVSSYKESIEMNSDGIRTYSTSMPLDFSSVSSSVRAYVAKKVDNGNNGVTLEQVTSVPAGTGIILQGTAGATVSVPMATSAPTAITKNFLVATVEKTTISGSANFGYNYIFGKDTSKGIGFFHVASGKSFESGDNRAYLKSDTEMSDQLTSSAKFLSLVFEDETTSINNVKREKSANNIFYTLSGIRVSQPQKGLYIVNGKKVIVK